MKCNQAKHIAATWLVIGAYCGLGRGCGPARAELPQAEEARVVAVFRVAPEADVRPQVRELVREVLDGLDASKDVVIRTERAAACAVVQARMGDAKEARQTFRQAREYISNKENLAKVTQIRVANAMSQLARSCADAGEVEELHEVLKALPDPEKNYRGTIEDFRRSVAQGCVTALAKAGKSKEALALAKEITADSGPEASRIKPEAVKTEVLREIALYHARAGDLKEAWKALDSIPDAASKVQTMAGTVFFGSFELPSEPGIAMIQDQAGDRDGAGQTLKQALELVLDIDNPDGRTRMQASIACSQARIGDLAGAQKTLEQIPKESKSYLLALVAVARAQAAGDQAKEALEAVDKLSTPSERINGLCQIIYGQGQAGVGKAARSTGEKALALALSLPEQERRSVRHYLAQARATAKDIEGALETVSKLTSGLDDAVLTYSNIAMVQVRGSDIKGALNTVEEHIPKDGFWHNRSLAAIASAQAERGQDKEALAWVRKLTDSDTQADCLLGVANGLLLANKVGIRRP